MTLHPWSLQQGQLTLHCHVQPGARHTQLQGLYDNCLKIQLKVPPVDGKANRALIEFFADLCAIPKSAIHIQRGQHNRRKTLLIDGICEIPEIIKKQRQA